MNWDWAAFWNNFFANITADAIIAIVLGLWLSKVIGDRSKKQVNQERKDEILSLIKHELLGNVESAKKSINSLEKGKRLEKPGLNTEIWDFFVSSGELSWLSDELNLFNALSYGYHSIKAIRNMEPIYYETVLKYVDTDREHMMDVVSVDLLKGYNYFVEAVEIFLAEEPMRSIDQNYETNDEQDG